MIWILVIALWVVGTVELQEEEKQTTTIQQRKQYMIITSCKLIEEREDGSAVYSFDFTPEEMEAIFRFGVIEAIKLGIEEGKKYDPERDKKPKQNSELNNGKIQSHRKVNKTQTV